MFTIESSFTHVKDKMHQAVTEHVIQDDDTKKLYHYVVSYGSWFSLHYDEVFMSHLFSKIGITGFGKCYAADKSTIKLPWYHPLGKQRQVLVELPKTMKCEDFEFGCKTEKMSETFKQTFLGHKFRIKVDDEIQTMEGYRIIRKLFRFREFQIGYFDSGDGCYPLYTAIECSERFDDFAKKGFCEILKSLHKIKHAEIYDVLEKFTKIDLKEEFDQFKKDVGVDCKSLFEELLYRQTVVKDCLFPSKQTKLIDLEKEF